jgi:glycosyltransferase-like protein
MSSPPLRIAILTHSTNPRGGVVHSLALGDALTALGHEVVVHAPDANQHGFFRTTRCGTACVPAAPVGRDVTEMVETRIADYLHYFAQAGTDGFDVWHAQDGISANALATLKGQHRIAGFTRTVHHVDTFAEQRLSALQQRGISEADQLLVVSRVWQERLKSEFDRRAELVGNGVDRVGFSPDRDDNDVVLREKLNLAHGPVFLTVGGVEARKNTLAILNAFASIHQQRPTAQLLIAGGASVLDHASYQQQFAAALARSRLPSESVIHTGPLPQADMPALYRLACALVFASLNEGFGLVVLEAMACGTPVVVSRIAPFTEYLGEGDVCWCDPRDPVSIAGAMQAAADPRRRPDLIADGFAVAARHDWMRTAKAHLPVYAQLQELCHA